MTWSIRLPVLLLSSKVNYTCGICNIQKIDNFSFFIMYDANFFFRSFLHVFHPSQARLCQSSNELFEHGCHMLPSPQCLKFSRTVSSSSENHGNVALITGDGWHCTVLQLAFRLQGGLPLCPGGGGFYTVLWRPFSTFAGFLPLCPLRPHHPLLAWIAVPASGLLFSHLLRYSEPGPCYQ